MSEATNALQQQAARQVIGEALRELTVVSDEARFQIHLFSLEAKRRWNEIEGKLRHLESRIAEGVDESLATTELSRAIRELLIEQGGQGAPSMPVRALMKDSVRTCRDDQTLKDAAGILADAKCRALPVVDAGGTLVGILSERDICLAAYKSGVTLDAMPVKRAMQKDVVSASCEETVGSVAETMRRFRLRHIPITERDGRVVGMLCLRDLARQLERDAEPSLDPAWLAATVVDIYGR
ncbi:MAG: CBS domain-containing protein [Myxococcota bacterium]